jgi:DMSO/TMAO reductase YedYZ molybdopterin-dependent catalytic subunit
MSAAPPFSRPLAPISRRRLMGRGVAALGVLAAARLSPAALGLADPAPGDVVVPFLDELPDPGGREQVKWSEPQPWITPTQRVFTVGHYSRPAEIDPAAYRLEVFGQFDKPVTLTLEQLKARPRKEVTATLECSGNGSNKNFMGAIGNATWAGTPLAALLKDCGLKGPAVEIAFYGTDTGTEKLANQDVEQPFARTLPIAEAGRDDILLCYEMNGQPLPHAHGGPVRLVVPGWYGIAWVKWLTGVEARDRRLMTRFIARDYVTIRGEERNGKTLWRQTSVGPMNVKSIAARVVRRPDGTHVVHGTAWTQGKVAKVEVKVDDGEWAEAKLEENKTPHTWTFWSFEWKQPQAGEHRIVSRATDERGRVQPTADDAEIKLKRTYWEAYAQYPRRIRVTS